jgi:hypothetical protein
MTRYLALSVACFTAAASLMTAEAQQKASPPPAQQSSEADQAKAKASLMRMAEHLAKAQSFSVTIDAGYDVVQKSGEKIEFGEVRRILLNRPNDLRIDLTKRNGLQQQVFFDGTSVTVFTPGENIFASFTRPGSVDETLHYFVEDLQTPIPLSALLMTSLPQELEKRFTEVALVNHETIAGKSVEHLAARSSDADVQVWIADGDEPVPLRVVLTYKGAAGQPQFWATLSEWNLHPAIDPSAFVFVRPSGAESVAFMVPAAVPPKSIGGPSKVRK